MILLADPNQPANLTAAAELAGLTKGHGITQVLNRSTVAVTIHGVDDLDVKADGTEADIIYVIISGYGVLCCRDGGRIEFTAGDVMMVPAGAWHRFEEASPKFRTWRFVVGKPAAAKTAEDERASPLT